MEFVEKAQTLLVENAMYVGIGLFVAVLIAAGVWFYMSRGSSSSSPKNTLMNQARMNTTTTDVPAQSSEVDPASPPQPSQEELERQLASIGNMEALKQMPPPMAQANE